MKTSYLNDEFFSRLESLALNLSKDLAGFFGGKHLVRTYGQTVEFADYREYMLGDDIRRIDWNLFSRFEKFFIKLFTDERQMHVQIFIDCSASVGKVNEAKGAYAVALAAAIGYLAIHNMDKVSFHLINGDRAENPFGTIVGKTSFFNAMTRLGDLQFEGESSISDAVINCPTTGTNDGLTVIISDFFCEDDWKKAVDYLTYKKRQVMLLQLMDLEELQPSYSGRVHMVDAESMGIDDPKNMKLRINRSMQLAYDEAIKEFLGNLNTYCVTHGATFVSLQTNKPIEKVLFTELMQRGTIS